tara:strand:- start:111 stop:404 length:294 start_codon:yes stop_codon:yes gene_type:complete
LTKGRSGLIFEARVTPTFEIRHERKARSEADFFNGTKHLTTLGVESVDCGFTQKASRFIIIASGTPTFKVRNKLIAGSASDIVNAGKHGSKSFFDRL